MERKADTIEKRGFHAFQKLGEKLYAFSGNYSSQTAEVYSIAENTWQRLPNMPQCPIHCPSSVVFQDKIYILGYNAKVFMHFNPANNAFTSLNFNLELNNWRSLVTNDESIYIISAN
jgi:hypothetical protein